MVSDVADSLGGWNPEQRLAIFGDSHIGSYGTAALAFSLLSRGGCSAELPLERFTAYMVSAHVLCRWSALPLSYYLPPARDSEGQGGADRSFDFYFLPDRGIGFYYRHRGCCFAQSCDCLVLAAIIVSLLGGVLYLRKFGA